MADNVAITAGSGTSIAADDISSVFYQRVKISVGADGSATDLSSTNPMPVSLSSATLERLEPISTTFYQAYSSATTRNVIAAPGSGYRLRIVSLTIITTANGTNTITIKDGSTTIGIIPATAKFQGLSWNNLWLSENAAFAITSSGAAGFSVFGTYTTEAV